MEKKFVYLKEPEKIFVDIRETDIEIKDPFKGETIPIKDYVMLHSSSGYSKEKNDVSFLGLNMVFNDSKEKINRKSFWFRNSEIFACLCAIISPWIDNQKKIKLFETSDTTFLPNNWMNFLKVEVISIEPTYNWYGFVIDLMANKEHFTEDMVQLIESLSEKGYGLTLLAENRLGNNSSANIFIQISEKQSNGDSRLNNIFFNYKSLTLEKTNFKVEYQQKPYNLFNCFFEEIDFPELQKIFKKHTTNFFDAVRNFNLLFELMDKEYLSQNSYNALLLDLFDRNRNESSVDLDDRLKNLLKKTIQKGNNFSAQNSYSDYTWANLIKSVVRNNADEIYSKVNNNPSEIAQLFSKKMVIEKMERIYNAVLSRDDKEKEMKQYIYKQEESYEIVKKHILK